MTDRDDYYNRAKQQGYRARSAFKLRQIDEAVGLIARNDTVIDLGAAPGGWTQIAAEAVGPRGRVVAVDRASIDPFDADNVRRVRGDITDADTRDRIRVALAGGLSDPEPTRERATLGASADVVGTDDTSGTADTGDAGRSTSGTADTGDAGRSTSGGARERRVTTDDRDTTSGDTGTSEPSDDRPADVVISDMAPEMSGEYELDHARSIGLAESALETALALLAPGGNFLVKVFDGRDLAGFREEMAESFEYVRAITPDASRDSSSERYLVGVGRLDAPVAVGDEHTVEVVDTGEEDDGIAYVDGYTLFVPDATPGETVTVRVTDVRARFGFAERVD